MNVKIFQIQENNLCKDCNSTHGRSCLNKFESLKRVKDTELTHNCYKEVYSLVIEESEKNIHSTLEEIYVKFNGKHPDDFKGHSISVSDVIKINDDYYYCDSVGFKKINHLFNFKN